MNTQLRQEATLEDVERFAHSLSITLSRQREAWSFRLDKGGSIDTDSFPLHQEFQESQAGIDAACGVLVHFLHNMQRLRRS